MITIGRGIRWYNDYDTEVAFCWKHGFAFMQIWFRDGEILLKDVPEPREQFIRDRGFPVILHAVFDPMDFAAYGDRLLEIVTYLGHKDVIVHPVCKKSPLDENTGALLAAQAKAFSKKAKAQGITWYLENNSVIDGFHCTKEEIGLVYATDDYVQQLLDIAHIGSYRHLEEIVSVKFPQCLHAAGKHFAVPHEHLPLTKGDIDYKLIFQTYLRGYNGRVILEVDGTDEEIIRSKQVMEEALASVRRG